MFETIREISIDELNFVSGGYRTDACTWDNRDGRQPFRGSGEELRASSDDFTPMTEGERLTGVEGIGRFEEHPDLPGPGDMRDPMGEEI